MKKVFALTLAVLGFMAITGCAPGPNSLVNTADQAGQIAGFWSGLWHGFISFFTFVISLFSDSTAVYEIHNNGGWYNFGFILGVSTFFGGSGGGACKKF